MTADPRILPFREASRELAEEARLPIVLPTGTFVADASVAWLLAKVEDWHIFARVPRHDPGWFHASGLGQSDDDLISRYRGTEHETHSARTLRIFDLGSARDRDWKRYLRLAGVLDGKRAGRRVRFPNLKLTGECDAVVVDAQGDRWVLELKTINPYGFNALQQPQAAHLMQIHSYMVGLQIMRGMVLYENKGNQDLKLFRVEFDSVLWDGIVARLRRLRVEAELGLKALSTPEGRTKAAALEM